jgi:hypothetical protein
VRWLAALVAVCGLGCVDRQTAVRIEVSAPAGVSLRSLAIDLTVGITQSVSRTIENPAIPGTVLVLLQPVATELEARLTAQDSGGGQLSARASVMTVPDVQIPMPMRLEYGGASDGGSGDGPPGDGPPGDGPPIDAGAPDADGGSVCTGAAVALCEDFEAPSLAARWSTTGTVTLDTTVVHRGQQSLKLHLNALPSGTTDGTRADDNQVLSAVGNTVWIRAWMRLSALPAGNHPMQLIAIEQGGGSGAGDYLFIRSNATELYAQFSSDGIQALTPPPVNTWFCAIWRITLGTGTSGSMSLSGDLPLLDLPNIATQGGSPVTRLEFGPYFDSGTSTSQPALDMWLDDILVDANPLTCTQ